MGTEKRARQKANRQARLVAALEAQKKSQKRQQLLRIGGVVAAVFGAFVLYWLFARGSDSGQASKTTTTTSVAVTAPPPGNVLTAATPCPKADATEERTTTFSAAPPICIDPTKTYTAKVTTSLGPLTLTLDAKKAPLTVNNFVVLSRYHYYDGLPFHRIVSDFVAQAGDANPATPPGADSPQLGTGGPGYTFADELPASTDEYTPGSVAMANAGPNTNSSQFFIWYGPKTLPSPAYSLFGKVTDGFDTVGQELLAVGTASGKPSKTVTIDKIEIIES